MFQRTAEEAEAERLEGEIAEVCGLINAATGRLVSLIAAVLATGSWEGWQIRSPEHWVAWKCGASPRRAHTLVAMARRLGELPETKAALEAGELSEDQAAVVCRHVPASVDAEAASLARQATVSQLQRTLGRYSFEESDAPPREQRREVSFGYTDEGSWRLSALLPAEEGALWERALTEARESLVRAGDRDIAWRDAFVAVADRSLSGRPAGRPHYDRHTVLLHVEAGGNGSEPNGRLHLGPSVPEGVRRYLSCDSRVRLVFESGGRPVSVGRSFRTVPGHVRTVIEDRDGGCRVPGCARTKWLHVHHVLHWEVGGPTDTGNLITLCSKHHRLHHLGRLGIAGDADQPDGIEFTDWRGRPLAATSPPRPPDLPLDQTADHLAVPAGGWHHPPGARLESPWLYFNQRPRAG